MSSYTMELRKIVEEGNNIFNFKYDFYDESKRPEFERNFIRHFYFREIGCDTVERFKWYLEDKMRTVFPYYNSLFEAAQIEYNILDNYNIKEEFTLTRENTGKTAGVSSTVGQAFDTQTSNTHEVSDNSETGKATDKDNGTTTKTGLVTTDSQKDTDNETTGESKTVHKYHDTPQGLLTLEDGKYLSNLTNDTVNTTENLDGSETIHGTVDTDEEVKVDNTKIVDTDHQSKTDIITDVTFNGEQKTTNDNNTRTEMVGKQTETSVFTKKGNIGIDTDSDMITKHIRLQKTLRKIEKMFFDECEDLFMLVY